MGSTKEKRFVVYTHRRHTSERVATRATTCGGRGGLSRRPPSFLISRLNDSLEKKSQRRRRRRRDMGWKKKKSLPSSSSSSFVVLLFDHHLPPPFDPVKWKKKNTVPPLLLLLSLAICDARYKRRRRRRKSSFVFLMCVSCLQSPRRPRTWTRSPISSFYFKHFFILYSVKSSGQ